MYNSAVIINRKGDVHLNVRKTHLFYCDALWCSEGPGFKATIL
jgi:predicted amidohydrolase